jgi:4-hydroxy-2-oxoglutarate aldolase
LALANVAPRECKGLEQCCRAGNHDAARALQLRLLAPNAAVTSVYGIAGLKVALEAVGLKGGLPRPPLLPLGPADAEAVRKTLREAGIGPVR